MKIINGTYNFATVFTTTNSDTAIDDYAIAQLQMLCNNETSKSCKICVMPDVHPGKVCTIGLTTTIGDKLMPNLIGLDIGCGNHFIELDVDNEKNLYVVIHSGSRRLGREVTEYYLAEGHRHLKKLGITVPYELTYLEGDWKDRYLHDLEIVQEFAELNRQTMLDELTKHMKWKCVNSYSCIHNYVVDGILRKGAISARKGENVIIPINMRDGILLGTGLGNPDWNYSAPHGAGRIMNREKVKQQHTVSEFKSQMKGIYSSCIGKDTLDEAPFAYRSLEEIQEVIKDTVQINKILRPVYNFKAGGE